MAEENSRNAYVILSNEIDEYKYTELMPNYYRAWYSRKLGPLTYDIQVALVLAEQVKTTSPKRYCVRPNTGVILPRATCDFTVTMQAQRTAPPDLQVKDKFLVQTTVVPNGTTDDSIVPAFFSKETGRYIEESKLRVVLISVPQPLAEHPINVVPNSMPVVQVPVVKETLNVVNEVSIAKSEVPLPLKASYPPLRETPAILSEISSPVKEASPVLTEVPVRVKEAPVILAVSPPHLNETPAISVETHFYSKESTSATKESSPLEETPAPTEVAVLSDQGLADVENHHFSHVTDDVQNLKSKLNNLELKLEEAEKMIIKLREESRITIEERDELWQEMVLMRRKGAPRNQAGFPLLFVVYIALVSMSVGYLLPL